MGKTLRRLTALLAGAIFLGSAAMTAYQHHQYRLGDEIYAQAEELAGVPDFETPAVQPPAVLQIHGERVPEAALPEMPPEETVQTDESEPAPTPEPEPVWVDPYADALAAMDFTALREVNGEVLGWILIPGTPVSYPLLQGKDNEKYLDTTWRGSRSSVGSIFVECRNSGDLSDFNTVIYGHRTANRAMFGSLKYYAQQSYLEEHPLIYINDDSGCRIYAVFAAYEVGVQELTYRIGFEDEKDREEFLEFCVGSSVIDAGILPETDDSILTLSTCTGHGYETRWVVQAMEI